MTGLQQQLEPAKERIDEIADVSIAIGTRLDFCDRKQSTHSHRVNRLVVAYETGIVASSYSRWHIPGTYRCICRNDPVPISGNSRCFAR